MLAGFVEPSSGEAHVGGFDIQHQRKKLHEIIGVCPQFDTVWPELTVWEHFKLYARRKGTPTNEVGARRMRATSVHVSIALPSVPTPFARKCSSLAVSPCLPFCPSV